MRKKLVCFVYNCHIHMLKQLYSITPEHLPANKVISKQNGDESTKQSQPLEAKFTTSPPNSGVGVRGALPVPLAFLPSKISVPAPP